MLIMILLYLWLRSDKHFIFSSFMKCASGGLGFNFRISWWATVIIELNAFWRSAVWFAILSGCAISVAFTRIKKGCFNIKQGP